MKIRMPAMLVVLVLSGGCASFPYQSMRPPALNRTSIKGYYASPFESDTSFKHYIVFFENGYGLDLGLEELPFDTLIRHWTHSRHMHDVPGAWGTYTIDGDTLFFDRFVPPEGLLLFRKRHVSTRKYLIKEDDQLAISLRSGPHDQARTKIYSKKRCNNCLPDPENIIARKRNAKEVKTQKDTGR